MASRKIHIILLSGGSGNRLWPLSNETRSKQFLKVLHDEQGNHVSMVQRVFSQIKKVNGDIDIVISTGKQQEDSLNLQLDGDFELVLEPARRDTFPAILLSTAYLRSEKNASPEDTVVVMPIDTYVEQAYYDLIPSLHQAVQDNFADLVLIGIKPSFASTKYGYILPDGVNNYSIKASESDLVDAKRIQPHKVMRFKEKPSKEEAENLLAQGALWNGGVFAFKLGNLEKLRGGVASSSESFQAVYEHYEELPKQSFDYVVVENAKSVAFVPYEGLWKDLGTWNALTEEMKEPSSGSVILDSATVSNVHAINETQLPMVISGINDAVAVATPDGILLAGKEQTHTIKGLVEQAAVSRPMYEQKRWGNYQVLYAETQPNGYKTLVKRLDIRAGCQLSYQHHLNRREIWTISHGIGEVVLDGEVATISSGSVVEIGPHVKHSVIARTDLVLIEVQIGLELEEEDIERFGNWWEDQVTAHDHHTDAL